VRDTNFARPMLLEVGGQTYTDRDIQSPMKKSWYNTIIKIYSRAIANNDRGIAKERKGGKRYQLRRKRKKKKV
jgi:hypothetical protein